MLPSLVRRAPDAGPSVLGRPLVASVLLVAAYLLIAFLGDPRAGLGSDSGGKLATARVMSEAQTLDPDVGYWAEDADPTGRFHPLVNTEQVGDTWVQATSLPYSAATSGLWSLAGALGPALLSMAGGLAGALAARRLADRLGGRPDLAFWLVGLASPLAVYATDTWEHAPAIGLALWGIVVALECAGPAPAALAGGLLGGAVVLRAEVGATVLAFGVATLAVAGVRTRWTVHPRRIAAAALAGGAVLVANAALERVILDAGVRDARVGTGASAAGSELGRRATDAVLTGAGLFADESAAGLLLGVLLIGSLAVLALHLAGNPRVTGPVVRAATVVVVGLYVLRLLDGWSFVPGALAVAPVIVLAVLVPRTDEVKVLLATALGAVPLVWLLQWRGNHVAQWGGRYLLLSTVLLLVLAAVALSGPLGRQRTARLLLGLTVVSGLAGLGWHTVRTNAVGAAVAAVDELPEDAVVVATDQHLGRELGSRYDDRRWLSADSATVDEAVTIAVAADPATIVVIGRPQPDGSLVPLSPVPGYQASGSTTIPALGDDLEVRFFDRD